MIEYRNISDGPCEICADLCNSLMQYKAKVARRYKKVLSSMTFENSLKLYFDTAKERFLMVAMDGDEPVGYIFATTEEITDENVHAMPNWAESFPEDSHWLYPENVPRPYCIGEIVDIYIKPDYRGQQIGRKLTDAAMEWLHERKGLTRLMAFASNGNNPGPFYEKYGFEKSFDVLEGMITAYQQEA